MRVLILAATTQKAQVASKLLESDQLSAIPLSLGCKKLVSQAQGLIIYFEDKEDLKSMKKLIDIYMGVPIKFFFGSFNYNNDPNFFDWQDAQALIDKIIEVQEEVQKSSAEVYKLLRESSKVYAIKLEYKHLKEVAKQE
jgi:hypothetical protein